MEKKTFLRRLDPGQELEDIPENCDSREVLIGKENPSPIFVIKDQDQVLPYCVINFTRGLAPSPVSLPSGANSGAQPIDSQRKTLRVLNGKYDKIIIYGLRIIRVNHLQ